MGSCGDGRPVLKGGLAWIHQSLPIRGGKPSVATEASLQRQVCFGVCESSSSSAFFLLQLHFSASDVVGFLLYFSHSVSFLPRRRDLLLRFSADPNLLLLLLLEQYYFFISYNFWTYHKSPSTTSFSEAPWDFFFVWPADTVEFGFPGFGALRKRCTTEKYCNIFTVLLFPGAAVTEWRSALFMRRMDILTKLIHVSIFYYYFGLILSCQFNTLKNPHEKII